jgi:hypothetical protein
LLPTPALLITFPVSVVLLGLHAAATIARAPKTNAIANFFMNFDPFLI